MFENYTRFEWGVEVGVVTIFVLRLFVPHEFDMLQMETLRFYTAGNQNILIRIPYNSLGCGACCMKLKKLTQESNAVFQKQGYYFSSKQLL